jgi:ribosomal protein S18 acetylase RimI-like enzyme
VTSFRPFRNGDPPALAELWNRGLPHRCVAGPLSPHDFDSLVIGKLHFDAAGLIVAERESRVVGFAHAGFGPLQPSGPSQALCNAMGTVAMLVVDHDRSDPELEFGLLVAAERYLRDCGASVVYAGGQYPVNPFYWSIYGGSEWAGILSSHMPFVRVVQAAGYEPVSTTALLEADLTAPEVRNPMSPVVRRRARIEVSDDIMLDRWWDALAIGAYRPMLFRLTSRADDRILARALTWDMSSVGYGDGRGWTGLVELEVDQSCRRQGYGRHLVAEILRHCRDQFTSVVSVQTSATNLPAIALYESLGFKQVEAAYLYRLPVRQGARQLGEPVHAASV